MNEKKLVELVEKILDKWWRYTVDKYERENKISISSDRNESERERDDDES